MANYGATLHIDAVHINATYLTHLEDGGGVLVTKEGSKDLTISSGGTAGQILSYTGTGGTNIAWINSASSSIPLYVEIDFGTSKVSDPIEDYEELDSDQDVYAINLTAGDAATAYAGYLPDAAALGTKLTITIIGMNTGASYQLHMDSCVFNNGDAGYLDMDAVGQGANLVYTGKGWAMVGGGGATPMV
jgi:hypothetical protein